MKIREMALACVVATGTAYVATKVTLEKYKPDQESKDNIKQSVQNLGNATVEFGRDINRMIKSSTIKIRDDAKKLYDEAAEKIEKNTREYSEKH